MDSLCVVRCASAANATRIARHLVERDLCSSVQLIGATNFARGPNSNEVVGEPQFLLMIRTQSAAAVVTAAKSKHELVNPEISCVALSSVVEASGLGQMIGVSASSAVAATAAKKMKKDVTEEKTTTGGKKRRERQEEEEDDDEEEEEEEEEEQHVGTQLKKQGDVMEGDINLKMINAARGKELAEQYKNAQPIPKARFSGVFSQDLLEDVYDSLALECQFEPRSTDLYQFSQTEDLRSVAASHPVIERLAKSIYGPDMLAFMSNLTGIELSNQIDVFASLYTKGCHLLPHDDRMTTRRVAFMLYLTPLGWTENDGGHLRFFYLDKNRMPDAHHYDQWLPEWGTFAAFTVSEKSFHMVCEVTSDLPRVAIGGWFHGKKALSVPPLLPYFAPVPPVKLPKGKVSFDSHINALYHDLTFELCKKMRKRGAVVLQDFFLASQLPKKPGEIAASPFSDVGPLHVQYYQRSTEPKGLLGACARLFGSQNTFGPWLSKLAGVRLNYPRARLEVRRFLRGHHYTLLYDSKKEDEEQEDVLEVVFTLLSTPQPADDLWDESFGGILNYIDSESGDVITDIIPVHNAISIVRKEPEVKSFVKFLSHYSPADRYDVVLRVPVGEPVADGMEISSSFSDDEEEGEGGEGDDAGGEGYEEEEEEEDGGGEDDEEEEDDEDDEDN